MQLNYLELTDSHNSLYGSCFPRGRKRQTAEILLDPLSLNLRSHPPCCHAARIWGVAKPQRTQDKEQARIYQSRKPTAFVGPDNRGYAAVTIVIRLDRHPRRRCGHHLFPSPAAFADSHFERHKRREMHHQGEGKSRYKRL
jgi:hypothetical protein